METRKYLFETRWKQFLAEETESNTTLPDDVLRFLKTNNFKPTERFLNTIGGEGKKTARYYSSANAQCYVSGKCPSGSKPISNYTRVHLEFDLDQPLPVYWIIVEEIDQNSTLNNVGAQRVILPEGDRNLLHASIDWKLKWEKEHNNVSWGCSGYE